MAVCFLAWRLFPQTEEFHLRFELRESGLGVRLSDRLVMQVFQWPNFTKGSTNGRIRLKRWLCFFGNAER